MIIPCRNESGHIPSLVERLPDLRAGSEFLFVEGNSTDDTEAVHPPDGRGATRSGPLRFLKQPGRGKGDAVRLGFAEATGDILLILDSDLGVAPEDVPKFVDALARGKGDMVNGSRLVYPMEGQAMRFLNLIANKSFAILFSWLLGQQVRDTLCGTKALWREDYLRIAANRGVLRRFRPLRRLRPALRRLAPEPPHRRSRRALPRAPVRRDQHLALPPRLAAAADERLRRAQAQVPLTAQARAAGALTPQRAALVLVALAVVPFARVLFAGHVLYERDIHLLRWGEAESFARCVAASSFPLWNAFAGFGRPLLADPGAQALYPWTWLGLLLQPHDWYDAYALAHVALGGLGVFALARRLGTSVAGGFLSGALFMLAGPFLSVVSLWQHLAGAALLPWVLLAGETALAAPGLVHALAWGAIVALQVLAGSLDFVVLGALAQAGLATRHATGGPRRDVTRRSACVLGAAAFAVALSAVQWLPAVELLRTTVRAQVGESVRALWSVHPVLLLQTLAPLFPHDLPLGPAARSLLFDNREPLLASLYLGAASLPLVVAALLSPPRRLVVVLAALGMGAVLLALGRHGFAFFWAADALPGLAILRYPVKTMVLAALAWALLAGRGVDAWSSVPRSILLAGATAAAGAALGLFALWTQAPAIASRWLGADPGGRPVDALLAGTLAPVLVAAVAAALAALLATVSALRPRTRNALVGAALATAVVDLALAHKLLVPSAPRDWFAGVPGVVALAKEDRAERLYLVDYLRRGAGREGPSWKPEESKALMAHPSGREPAS